MKTAAEDPFREYTRAHLRARLSVLGGDFAVESADAALLELAVEAFDGLPKHRLHRKPHRFIVRLVRAAAPEAAARRRVPPRPVLSAGAGLLCATVDASSFAIVDARLSRALISISSAMLRRRYYARYELIELAFLTLAARAQALVPLHAACVGANGQGLLLMGASGTGKSTLSLHALAGGMQLLSEDSAFVALDGLRVTGVPNYLHVAPPSLRCIDNASLRYAIERSPVIERRSGARKFEVDLRKLTGTIARMPLRLAATVFLSRRAAGRQPALRALERDALIARLRREQPYASAMPNWLDFERAVAAVPAYVLQRTQHPDAAIGQLRQLL